MPCSRRECCLIENPEAPNLETRQRSIRRRRLMASAGILAAFLLLNSCCPVVWFSPSVHGRVVDQLTGLPVANAVVAASWRLEGLESYPVRCLQIAEATTNAEGKFSIPGWGPRFHFGQGGMSRTQPILHVIADGYLPVRSPSSHNVTSAYIYAGPSINGRELYLRRTELTEAAYGREL